MILGATAMQLWALVLLVAIVRAITRRPYSGYYLAGTIQIGVIFAACWLILIFNESDVIWPIYAILLLGLVVLGSWFANMILEPLENNKLLRSEYKE